MCANLVFDSAMNDPHVLCQVVVAAGGIGGVVTVGTHLILDFEQFEQLMVNRFHVVVQVLLCNDQLHALSVDILMFSILLWIAFI